jgi:hypothetical protein
LLRVINEDLFEGKETQRIPGRGWEKANFLKMAGIMIAHSILHGGPSFPVLARYVYRYIVTGNTELAAGYIEADATIDILYTLDSASLLVKLKPRIFQRLPPFE